MNIVWTWDCLCNLDCFSYPARYSIDVGLAVSAISLANRWFYPLLVRGAQTVE